MKCKEEKAERFQALPAHQIDSSVFIEILLAQRNKDKCFSYLYNFGKTYRLCISISVLGEISKFILEFPELNLRKYLFESFEDLIEKFEVNIFAPTFKTFEIIPAVIKVNNRLESMDALNYASAIDANAEEFITLDNDFDKTIESTFGVKIKNLS